MKNKKESYEPFESIPADKSFFDRAVEWSSMYSKLVIAKKIKNSDDLSTYTNEKLKDMLNELEGEEEVERLRKEFVITKEELEHLK